MADVLKIFLFFCAVSSLFTAVAFHEKTDIGVEKSLAQFRVDSKYFASTLSILDSSLQRIDSSKPETIEKAKMALRTSRVAYKQIEYLLEYFFATSSRIYNRAPKNEIEEPYIEYQEPAGLQYIEAMLFDSIPETHKEDFQQQIRLLTLSANALNSLLYKFQGEDKRLLEAVRIELVRIMALGITGFDAPSLKSGIQESEIALKVLEKVLDPYLSARKNGSDSVKFYLRKSTDYLKENSDFDTFNRLDFLTNCILPLQSHLGKWITFNRFHYNRDGILNYESENLFSINAFNAEVFSNRKPGVNKAVTSLGAQLFSESLLSGNNQKSCISCHNPQNYFMDGLPKSIGFDQKTNVRRNAPTLLYAKFQHNQFWDGRAKTLEEQVRNVIQDPKEMNGNIEEILAKINSVRAYRKSFSRAFGKKRGQKITDQEIYLALASYIRTLNPYNSPFDQYMHGNKKALTESQRSGFNLFMGKAQCATCHFAPLFNGLIPPLYALTEFEILGTTKTDNLKNPEADPDEGRFDFRPTPYYKGAFKTPTVRNAAKTAPYMHNGAFNSLETLIEFYDQGGGAGLGLSQPQQTLSPAKLNLTQKEKKDIISFIEALTDDLSTI